MEMWSRLSQQLKLKHVQYTYCDSVFFIINVFWYWLQVKSHKNQVAKDFCLLRVSAADMFAYFLKGPGVYSICWIVCQFLHALIVFLVALQSSFSDFVFEIRLG